MKDANEPMDQQDQPDADYIKMFVGQVPRSMDEAQLREMFEEFGRVHTINVLRDKATGLSKGECGVAIFIGLITRLIKISLPMWRVAIVRCRGLPGRLCSIYFNSF